jgi:hypothetical protein
MAMVRQKSKRGVTVLTPATPRLRNLEEIVGCVFETHGGHIQHPPQLTTAYSSNPDADARLKRRRRHYSETRL